MEERLKYERCGIIFFAIVLTIAGLFDFRICQPIFLLDNIDNQISLLFQSQVTLSVLGIAIVSLLSGFINKRFLGVPVAHFIMYLRAICLTHPNIIFIELILILVSYIFVMFQFYNIILVIFVLSILLLMVMIKDSLIVFCDKTIIEKEIKQYIMDSFSKNKKNKNQILEYLLIDSKIAIKRMDVSQIEENLDCLRNIFGLKINDDDINKLIEKYIVIVKLYINSNNSDVFRVFLDSFVDICEVDNKDTKFSMEIWKGFENELFRNLEGNSFEELIIDILIYKVRSSLYLKISSSEDEYKYSKYLYCFSMNIYWSLLKKMKRMDKKKQLFDSTIYFIENLTLNKDILYRELAEYTKILIDNGEVEVLEKCFKEMFKNKNKEAVKYVFSIVFYLYYLYKEEPLANELQKETAENILLSCSSKFGEYIEKTDKNLFIESIKTVLEWTNCWEIFPIKGAKVLRRETVIEEISIFIMLFSMFEFENTEEKLTKNIEQILKNNEKYIYNFYFARNVLNKTYEKYKKFLSCFYREKYTYYDEKNYIEAEFKRFTRIIEKEYQNYEFQEIKNNELEESDISELAKKIEVDIFQNLADRYISLSINEDLNTDKVEVTVFESNELIKYLDENRNFMQHIVQCVSTSCLAKILKDSDDKKIDKFVENSKEEIFKKLEQAKKDFGNSMDVAIIGIHRDEYNKETIEKDKKLIQNINLISSEGLNNVIIAIASSRFYFKVKKVSVSVDRLTETEILNSAKERDDGMYDYNVCNDNMLTYTREELIQYLSKARRMVRIKLVIEYGFDKINKAGVIAEIEENN